MSQNFWVALHEAIKEEAEGVHELLEAVTQEQDRATAVKLAQKALSILCTRVANRVCIDPDSNFFRLTGIGEVDPPQNEITTETNLIATAFAAGNLLAWGRGVKLFDRMLPPDA